MAQVLFLSLPFNKQDVILALEAGADGIITEQKHICEISSMARVKFLVAEDVPSLVLKSKQDEESAAELLKSKKMVVLKEGWEVIPVENLLAVSAASSNSVNGIKGLGLEVSSLSRAQLALGILECGVEVLVVLKSALAELSEIVKQSRLMQQTTEIAEAVVTDICSVGLGHRVCVDTLSVLEPGQGMLVGDSSAFTFLVQAETEHNPYVAARPFRVNAGAVHAYALMPEDKTNYLHELESGQNLLIVDWQGKTGLAVMGRAKVEIRPMLKICAKSGQQEGSIFLQNAETIRLVQPGGKSVSVVDLKKGDIVCCHLDTAGRHFGIRIKETINE